MPIVQYCKSCGMEVPPEESCALCGKKLPKASLRLCFLKKSRSVGDWYCYSGILRIWIPIWLLVFLLPPIPEYCNHGINGVAAMLEEGYPFIMLAVMAAFLLLLFLVLLAQGEEITCYTFTSEGLEARGYLNSPSPLQLWSRFLTKETVAYLAKGESRSPAEGLVLVRRDIIPWEKVRKVKCWRQGMDILIYRPHFWRILVIHCTRADYDEAENWVRSKMKRYKKVPVLPRIASKNKRKKKS